MTEGAPRPLSGVVVLDLTHAMAGPYCTMHLGDLGADVLKLEPPQGDESRAWGPPFLGSESSYFLSVNRNKRSLVLDLRTTRGQELARELAQRADILVENFRPGKAAELGLDAQELRRQHRELVYASISGFGAGHPELTGYDQIAQGSSGLMSLTGEPGGRPTKVGVPLADIAAGMFAAHAILAALVERERTGVGRIIDVALNDSLLAMLTYQAGWLFARGEPPPRWGNAHASIVPYGTFATADGEVNLAAGSNPQFQRLCSALGLDGLAEDRRFGSNPERCRHREELLSELEPRLRQLPTAECLELLARARVPAGPVHDLAAALSSPLALERGMRRQVSHPDLGEIEQVGAPWKLDGESSPIRRPPPRLGEHTAEVLRELGGRGSEPAGVDDAL
ncbi:MAG: CaiB/BaiF CoA transferase family protein [Candidatus Dormibacteria bacterium]